MKPTDEQIIEAVRRSIEAEPNPRTTVDQLVFRAERGEVEAPTNPAHRQWFRRPQFLLFPVAASAIALVLVVSGVLTNDSNVNVRTTDPTFADQVDDGGSRSPEDRETEDTKPNPIDESVPTTIITTETTVVPETTAVPRTTVPKTTVPPTTTTPIICTPTVKGGGTADPVAAGSTSLSSPRISQEFFADATDVFVIEGQTTPGATLVFYFTDPSVSPPVDRAAWYNVSGFVQPDGSFRIAPNQAQGLGPTKVWVEASFNPGGGPVSELVTTEFVGVSAQTCA
jgi:cytoskeletal protein RodZ